MGMDTTRTCLAQEGSLQEHSHWWHISQPPRLATSYHRCTSSPCMRWCRPGCHTTTNCGHQLAEKDDLAGYDHASMLGINFLVHHFSHFMQLVSYMHPLLDKIMSNM